MRAAVAQLVERVPAPLAAALRWGIRHSNVAMFVAGFLFDVLTLQRIDARADLAIQLAYLVCLTVLIVLQHREAAGLWRPSRRLARWWPYSVDLLHFLYGGLLSAYVVLYFRSSTGARPLLFFALLVVLMVANEMPQARRAGHRLRLGVYAFCVLSFLNYFVPILVGRMGGWVFLLSLLLAALVVWVVADRLAARDADRRGERRRLFVPAAAVCGAVALLYLLRLVPPVPLSVQFQGIYHDVRRMPDGGYALVYERQPLWQFWRRDDRLFRRRSGDRVFYFLRVFAPADFRHQVFTRWEVQDPQTGEWRTSDRIGLPPIRGGRPEGFRTYAVKSNFHAGRWRVTAETDDGRAIATVTFRVEEDMGEGEREWVVLHS